MIDSLCECERWRDGIRTCPIHPDSHAPRPVDTINDCMVAGRYGDGKVQILAPPLGPMDRDQALRLAAWLVVIADPSGKRFDEIRKAVMST